MEKILSLLFVIVLLSQCSSKNELQLLGEHYQKHQDYSSLKKVVDLMPMESDSVFIKKILGEPIDMGFDYRYLIDSIGPNGCTIGAVFHFDEFGKNDQKWIDEICE